MTVKIGDKSYRNVARIDDCQTKAIEIRLMLNDSKTIQIPVTENDEIIFVMEGKNDSKGN